MTQFDSLGARIKKAPAHFDVNRAARAAEALESRIAGGPARDLLLRSASNSAYLARLIAREKDDLARMLGTAPEAELETILAPMLQFRPSGRAEALEQLRQVKRRAALLIALCDLGGVWTVEHVCEALTRLADATLNAALRYVLTEMTAQGRYTPRDPANPAKGCGLFYVGMGKYGARELNYSSDIDFGCYFDPTALPVAGTAEPHALAVRITQSVVGLMEEITPDGYVFRCDLRLRPDAGSTQIAVPVEAAAAYYEAMGQNWERAAMIKARVCAGDIAAGEHFMRRLIPFVWRKYLDYAAIEDIHSIKRQIHAHGGHGRIAVAGHNVKLGRGGIREIEFFVQTQQLILGGRDPRLRDQTTLGALRALTERGVVSAGVEQDLTRAYHDLRTLEHRLQMIEDEQTHSIPKSPEGVENAARFMGYDDTAAFEQFLTTTLTTVQGHYGRLFESAPPLSESAGNLVFTGVDEDPSTVETLRAMGFGQAQAISATIRGWHHGRIRATRSERARERLTALMPLLLKSLSETANPDLAFTRFDRFLGGLPSGVQVFALLYSNAHLLKLMTDIVGTAPRLADHLARRPALFDVLTDAKFLRHHPGDDELEMSLGGALIGAGGFEGVLDAVRRWAKDQQFRIGLQILRGECSGASAATAFSRVAAAVIRALTKAVEAEIVHQHGGITGGAFLVLGMGKLGSHEMTASSDLDLIFIYDHAPGAAMSSGAKPLSPGPYYARLGQRLVTALTALTSEGGLYDVDMRLRPSGNKGPVAVSLESFRNYHKSEAWTWERMALTRARIIVGPEDLSESVQAAIRGALTESRDRVQVLTDVAEMRGRLAREQTAVSTWDLKDVPGGLLDIEFVAQGLAVAHAHTQPAVLQPGTRTTLEALGRAGLLDATETELLAQAHGLYEALLQVIRLATDGPFRTEEASTALRQRLLVESPVTSFDALTALLERTQKDVRAVFVRRIGPVAASLPS